MKLQNVSHGASEEFITLVCSDFFLAYFCIKIRLKETNKMTYYDTIKGMTLPIEYHLA